MTGSRRGPVVSRLGLVVAAAAVMGVVGSYQFVWSSIRGPLGARLAAPEAALGTVFTLFVAFQTLSQFPAGWVRDRYGPRPPMLVGGVLLGAGYFGLASAQTLPVAYLSYAAGGVGAGIAYTVAINTPVKWFSRRRGLATGAVTMATSGVSVLLIPTVRGRIDAEFTGTLLGLAALAGGVGLLGAVLLRDPPRDDGDGDGSAGETDAGPTPGPESQSGTEASQTPDGTAQPDEDSGRQAGDDPGTVGGATTDPTTWRDAAMTWQFWVLYAVFVVVNGAGLMLVGKVVAFADSLGLSVAVATAAASIVALADAVGVLLGGGLSDRLGGERTVGASLALAGVAIAGAVAAGEAGRPTAFVAFVAAAAMLRSPAFAVFPSLVGSYYGTRRSSEIYAVLYSAKLWGGLLGGTGASALIVAIGWGPAFVVGAGLSVVGGGAAFLLRPPAGST